MFGYIEFEKFEEFSNSMKEWGALRHTRNLGGEFMRGSAMAASARDCEHRNPGPLKLLRVERPSN